MIYTHQLNVNTNFDVFFSKLRQELGLQPISPEKYKLSSTIPYKPPKKHRKVLRHYRVVFDSSYLIHNNTFVKSVLFDFFKFVLFVNLGLDTFIVTLTSTV